MNSINELLREMRSNEPRTAQHRIILASAMLVIFGLTAFLYGISKEDSTRAWQAYLVNFLFWTGLAFGAVLFSATMTMTNARWGRPVKRLAEALGAFLPLSFLLFWVLYLGKEEIFPWIRQPLHHKEAWLNTSFLFARDGIALLLLAAIALGLITHSVRSDQKALSNGFPDPHAKTVRPGRTQSVLSPIYAFLYAIILTLLAVDLIMSLDPHWVSTLFGAYFFVGSFYSALAAIIILSSLGVRKMGLGRYIGDGQFHDLGKLLFGFCVLTGDFFYAQFVVIWYGNLPEESRFIIQRVRQIPWDSLAWTVLMLSFVLPFIVLLRRKIKMNPVYMTILCGMILLGMWLERFLLVAPSLSRGHQMPLGLMEVLISGGFFGLMVLCLIWFFRRFPMLPISDPLFRESLEAAHTGGH